MFTRAAGSGDRMDVNGYWRGELGLAARTYQAEFPRNGYSAGGAFAPTSVMLQFYGHFTYGRVDLRRTCGGRVAVHIVIQPGQ